MAACAALGLRTTAEKAAAFEVTMRAVRFWEAGTVKVPGPVRVALRCMALLRASGSGDSQQQVAKL